MRLPAPAASFGGSAPTIRDRGAAAVVDRLVPPCGRDHGSSLPCKPIAINHSDERNADSTGNCGRTRMSADPPTPDVSLRVGKDFLTSAVLVGAAMCSAFECGSQDRWP